MEYNTPEAISEIRFKKIRLWKNQLIIQTEDVGNIVVHPDQIMIFQTRRSVFFLNEKKRRKQTRTKTNDMKGENQNV